MKNYLARTKAMQLLAQYQLNELSDEKRTSLLEDWWSIDEDDPEFTKLPANLQAEMTKYDSPIKPLSKKYDPLLLIALTDKLSRVKNTYIKSQVTKLGIKIDEIKGSPIVSYKCPCCHYKSLPARGEFFICPVCFWEDDGSDNLEHYSGPNHMTLREAQENFLRFGACSEDAINFIEIDATEKYAKNK